MTSSLSVSSCIISVFDDVFWFLGVSDGLGFVEFDFLLGPRKELAILSKIQNIQPVFFICWSELCCSILVLFCDEGGICIVCAEVMFGKLFFWLLS